MEDISSLIWLGIIILWFLTRLIRRGARKAAGTGRQRPQPPARRPAAPPPGAPPATLDAGSSFSDRGGQGPPPIEPR